MSASRYADLDHRTRGVEEAGLARTLTALVPTGPTTATDPTGRELLVFSSNDYLGLSWEPQVRTAWTGGGCGSSRLISGTRTIHEALETELASRFGSPALVFSSGYQANLALLTCLFQKGDAVASDRLNHASIIDGLRLSGADRHIVPHDSPETIPPGMRGVIVEGLYSMDGDRPRLADIPREPWLVVDEAHAVGCIGPMGRGVAADQGIEPDMLVGTFGKAYGAAGAFVIGPPPLIDLLISTGRSFVYTTALAEPAARAALAGLRAATDERRERLAENVTQFRTGLRHLGLEALGRDHIVPIVTGPDTMSIAAALRDLGIFVPGIRPPTVAPGTERLRFSMSAAHTGEQIDRALDGLNRCISH